MKHIEVDCSPYGVKKLYYAECLETQSNGKKLLESVKKRWPQMWPWVFDISRELAEETIGIYDFDGSFDTHSFELGLDDRSKEEDVESVEIALMFEDSNGNEIGPAFCTYFEDGDVVHYQPVF